MEEKWVLDKAEAKKKWFKISSEDLEAHSGSKAELVMAVRSAYGLSWEHASKQVDAFVKPVMTFKGGKK